MQSTPELAIPSEWAIVPRVPPLGGSHHWGRVAPPIAALSGSLLKPPALPGDIYFDEERVRRLRSRRAPTADLFKSDPASAILVLSGPPGPVASLGPEVLIHATTLCTSSSTRAWSAFCAHSSNSFPAALFG